MGEEEEEEEEEEASAGEGVANAMLLLAPCSEAGCETSRVIAKGRPCSLGIKSGTTYPCSLLPLLPSASWILCFGLPTRVETTACTADPPTVPVVECALGW